MAKELPPQSGDPQKKKPAVGFVRVAGMEYGVRIDVSTLREEGPYTYATKITPALEPQGVGRWETAKVLEVETPYLG